MAPRQALLDALDEIEGTLSFVSGTPPEPPFTPESLADRLDRVQRWRTWVMWVQIVFCGAVGAVGLLSISGIVVPSIAIALLAGVGIGLAFGVRNLVYCAKAEQLYGVLLRLERDAESR
jgi:hypothetical protein